MKIIETAINDVKVIEPQVFKDERGFFLESFNQKEFSAAIGQDILFVQDNHSFSKHGVLRGLHYQVKNPQGKLVRVISGEVYDVAVDLRPASVTFGKWIGITLSAENKKQFWIPAGFAHGFFVKSQSAEFLYKTTDYWHPEYEKTLLWSDPTVAVQWPLNGTTPLLSKKDAIAPLFDNIELSS